MKKNYLKLGFLFIVLILGLAACSDDPQTIEPTPVPDTVDFGLTKKPTPTPSPTPTPTPTPSPTPTPLPGWDYSFEPVSSNSPVSVAKLPNIFDLGIYESIIPKVTLLDGEMVFFVGDSERTSLYTINRENGAITKNGTCFYSIWAMTEGTILDDGSLIFYDYDRESDILLDKNLELIAEYPEISSSTHLFRKDGTGFYYTEHDPSYTYTTLFFHDFETGDNTDLSSYYSDMDDFPEYFYLEELIFDDNVLIVNGTSYGHTAEWYISLKSECVWDSVEAEYIDYQTYGSSFLIEYQHVGYPELLFGDEVSRSNVKGIAYTYEGECSNASRFDDYVMTAGRRQEIIKQKPEFVRDLAAGVGSLPMPNDVNDIYELEDVPYEKYFDVLSCYNIKTGELTAQTELAVNSDDLTVLAPFFYDEKTGFAYGFLADYIQSATCIYKWDLKSPLNSSDSETSYIFAYSDDEDPSEEAIAQIRAEAEKISEKYNIVVRTGNDVLGVYDNYSCGPEFNVRLLTNTLKNLDDILSKYPEDFFTRLAEDITPDKVKFDLVADFTWSGDGEGINDAVALNCPAIDGHCVVINCNYYYSFKQTLYHELTHAADNYLYDHYGEYYDTLDTEWMAFIPDDFFYDYNYVENAVNYDYSYTMWNEDDNKNVYFIDNYSKSYPTEDRARIMEYYLYNGPEYYECYPHLMEKAEYLQGVYKKVFGAEFKFSDEE